MPPDTPIVELSHVSKRYAQGAREIVAVDDVSLSIARGDFATFSGPSGSGKSTLLNMMGLLDTPTEGQVRFEGRDVSALSRTARALIRKERIGFIFQAYNLIPVLTARENAELVLELQGVPLAERRARVAAVLDEVGLQGMHDRRPDELSGGQQQRVAIARAIASRPALVLADEPTANVDSATAGAILDLMEQLNREHQITFLFSTHDPNVMARARRIVRLVDGKIASDTRRDPATPAPPAPEPTAPRGAL